MEDAAGALLTHATSEGVAQRPPAVRAQQKIVFEYADSDDDEGTTRAVACESHALTMDADDMEDPLEAIRAKGVDADVASEASVDFVEDAAPTDTSNDAAEFYARHARFTALPDDVLPVPRAPDATVRLTRRPPPPQRYVAPAAGDERADVGSDEQQAEEEEEVVLRKRDRDVKVTAEGYHLTVDERDLVADHDTALTRPRRKDARSELEAAVEDAELGRSRAAAEGTLDDGAAAPAAPVAPAAPALAPHALVAAAEAAEAIGAGEDLDDDDEEDEEDDEEDEMMDDLLLVAAVEQMARCCETSVPELTAQLDAGEIDAAHVDSTRRTVECMERFLEVYRPAHAELCDDKLSPLDFGRQMRQPMDRLQGAMRRAARPPKAAPIVIDGVVMDM